MLILSDHKVVDMTVDDAPQLLIHTQDFTQIFNPAAQELYKSSQFQSGHERLVPPILTNVKYGHNLPFCSLIMVLHNRWKNVTAQHSDVTMKFTFDILKLKKGHNLIILS